MHILRYFKSECLTHIRKEDLQFLKQLPTLNYMYHLNERIEIVCKPFQKL